MALTIAQASVIERLIPRTIDLLPSDWRTGLQTRGVRNFVGSMYTTLREYQPPNIVLLEKCMLHFMNPRASVAQDVALTRRAGQPLDRAINALSDSIDQLAAIVVAGDALDDGDDDVFSIAAELFAQGARLHMALGDICTDPDSNSVDREARNVRRVVKRLYNRTAKQREWCASADQSRAHVRVVRGALVLSQAHPDGRSSIGRTVLRHSLLFVIKSLSFVAQLLIMFALSAGESPSTRGVVLAAQASRTPAQTAATRFLDSIRNWSRIAAVDPPSTQLTVMHDEWSIDATLSSSLHFVDGYAILQEGIATLLTSLASQLVGEGGSTLTLSLVAPLISSLFIRFVAARIISVPFGFAEAAVRRMV